MVMTAYVVRMAHLAQLNGTKPRCFLPGDSHSMELYIVYMKGVKLLLLPCLWFLRSLPLFR